MKLKRLFIVSLIILVCICQFTCSNSIVERWWDDIIVGGNNFAVVVFDANGGTPQPKAVKVEYGVAVGRLLPMSRGEFGFAGWYDERGNLWDVDTRPITKNDVNSDGVLLLTARWTDNLADIFTVNYYESDTVTLISTQKIARYGRIIFSVPPPSTSVGFAGWYDKDTNALWDFNTQITRNVNLYAKWDTPFCIVRFEPNGGTRPDGFTTLTHEFAIYTRGYGIVPDPGPLVKEGYYFGGWFTDAAADKWDFANRRVTESYPSRPPDPPVLTLFAKWIPQTRTVIFDQNGGQGVSPNVFIVNIGDRLINPGAPVRPGYTFLGWYFDPAGTPGNYIDFTRYTVPEPDGITDMDTIYLYAKWMTTRLYITFAIKDHGQVADQYVDYNERIQKPIITPPAGKYFDGNWFTDPSCAPGTEWNFETGRVMANRTLYGEYNDLGWTVTFNLRSPPGGTSGFTTPPTQRIRTGGKVVEPFMPPLPPTPAGVNETRYSFYRWDTSSDGINFTPYDFDTPVSGDFTLYARWVEPLPDMVWVPRGSFIMGDAGVSGSPAAYHAYPTRRITLDGFYISRYEITQEDGFPLAQTGTGYNQVMPPPYKSQFTGIKTRPVENVSWDDAMEYCRIRNGGSLPVYNPVDHLDYTKGGSWSSNGFRLPTEAEWEYAARGGYYWQENTINNVIYAGSSNPDLVAWYNNTVKTQPSGFQTTQTVGRLGANRLGIYDMSGNLSEWCYDWFAPYSSQQGGADGVGPNPAGPASGTERVRRGGAWNNAAGNVRVVVRNSEVPTAAHWAVGFRVVRGPAAIY